jgi:peptide/nickel transport system substrate-binding protein
MKKSEDLNLSRRQFGLQMAAMGVAASGIWLPERAMAQAQATPKKGGTLRIGMAGGTASDSLDPRTYSDSIPIAASLMFMNGLIEVGADGKAKGELLESWSTAPGAKQWTFNVRKNIKFTSGKILDADDIIYSIGLHLGDTKSGAKSLLKQIKEVKKLSSNQVQFMLEDGNAEFPLVLSDYHLVVVPNGFTNWSKPDGTGAFVLDKFEPGVRITGKSKGDYWKTGRGNFENVEILYINDKTARIAALQSGKVDAISRVDPRTASLLANNPKTKLMRTPGSGLRYCFSMDVTSNQFNNKDLRLAMKYGIDRKKIIDTVFGGYALPGNDHTLSPSHAYYNHSMPQHSYDPDKAAFYFKKAGLGSKTIELQTSEGAWDTAVDSAVLYQESLRKAGTELTLKKVSADGYWSNVWLKQPFCAAYWGGRPTADIQFSTTYKSDSNWNESKWKSSEFDKTLLAARVELNEKKRKELYDYCQELIANDGGTVCFAVGDYLDAYSPKVMGVQQHPRYELVDNRIAEVGWFA